MWAPAAVGRDFDLPEDTLRRWMDPLEAVAARKVQGGTAPDTVAAMLAEMDDRLAHDEAARSQRRDDLDRAARNLADRVAAMTP